MTDIEAIRMIIDDKDSVDFTNAEIQFFLDQVNSINCAVYNLARILITKLRKQLLESDTTGAEKTDIASLRDRLAVLESTYKDYKDLYNSEINNNSGLYISTVKPTICGGDY